MQLHKLVGADSERPLPKRSRGQRNSTGADIIAAIRELSRGIAVR